MQEGEGRTIVGISTNAGKADDVHDEHQGLVASVEEAGSDSRSADMLGGVFSIASLCLF